MNPGRAFAGLLGVALALGAGLFALVSMVAVSWRNWFGMQKKDEPKPPPPRKPTAKKK